MSDRHALPLYVQISELLIRDIQAGRLADGERLPPERDMAVQMGTSVGTLRKSLADLAEKGLLERRQGSGNYVRYGASPGAVYSFFRLELAEGGGLPTAEILSLDLLPKPSDYPEFGEGAEAYRIRRLRRLSGKVAAVEEIWLDATLAPGLAKEDLVESLYLYYRDRLGFWVQRVEDRVGVGWAPDWSSALFGALGKVDRVSWDQLGRRVEVSRTWFDPDVARYISRMS